MANPYNLHKSRIDWKLISEEDFNRTVEALLVKVYTDEHQIARTLDGRGGDGGIDVAVWRKSDNTILHIFQLKYFPEGFTGGFRNARRPQIVSSFETAWKNHEPAAWTLVMPNNPHNNELQFVMELPAGRDVKVDIIGIAQLDELLAQHPHIEAAILNDGVVEIFQQLNLEKAALTGNTDLQERVEGLQAIASNRSLYWDTSFQMNPFGYEEFYTPKHPDAMKHEPIQTQFTMSLGEEHNDVVKDLQKILDFGSFEEVKLPPGAGKLERTGPSWVAPLHSRDDSEFSLKSNVVVPKTKEIITLNLQDQWGFTKGRFEGVVRGRAFGVRGVSIQIPLNSCLTLILRLASPKTKTSQGQFGFQLNIEGALVDDALQGIRIMESFAPGLFFDLYFNGNKVGHLQIDEGQESSIPDDYLLGLLQDLVFIQQKTGLDFVVPKELSPRERIMLRVAKLLLEGKGTHLPEGVEFPMELNGEHVARVEEILFTGLPVFFTQSHFPFDFQKSRINLGEITVFSRRVTTSDNEEIRAAIEKGDVEGLELRIRPTSPETWWIYPADVSRDENGGPVFADWELPGTSL